MCIGYKKHIANIVSRVKSRKNDENRMKMIKKEDVFDKDGADVTAVI